MIKLYDFAIALDDPNQPVILQNKMSRRICFEGRADQLAEYSGIDYRKVASVKNKNGVLYCEIK